MTFTYNPANIGSSGLSAVRFWTGETSSDLAVLQDEEIQAILNDNSNHKLAAAQCLDALAAYYARQADTRNEGLDVMASQRSKAYREQASQLRRRAYQTASIFVGGRSEQTKRDRTDDSDYVQPAFTRELDDFYSTVSTSTE